MPDTPPGPALAPAPTRDAASLVVWRDSPAGTEVLMGLRGAGHRFMPNRLVFPGGAVDPADHHGAAATPPLAATLALLGKSAPPPLAYALAFAAARELQEETGLTLGGATPTLDRMDYLCRAITPSNQPIRFHARFLVTEASATSGTLAGDGELEGLGWYTVTSALAMELAPPQRLTLEALQSYLCLPSGDRRSVRRTPAMLERVVVGE